LKFLLDTNIIIYAYRRQGGCVERIRACSAQDVVLCSVNVFELEYGLAQSQSPQVLQVFLRELMERHATLEFDTASARQAGRVRAHLRKLGTPIGDYDVQIAGIALANNLTVVTHNTREFSRVPGLSIEDWYA
jgi:tRNA(fMet)-specific endonuclease VapC